MCVDVAVPALVHGVRDKTRTVNPLSSSEVLKAVPALAENKPHQASECFRVCSSRIVQHVPAVLMALPAITQRTLQKAESIRMIRLLLSNGLQARQMC